LIRRIHVLPLVSGFRDVASPRGEFVAYGAVKRPGQLVGRVFATAHHLGDGVALDMGPELMAHSGPQAIVDGVFMRLGEIGDNFSVNVTQLVAEGDTVVGLGTYSWNRNGSGEPAEVKIAHVWTLASVKVTRFQQHVDTAKERYLIA
jgi:hypothetical protein